MGLNSVDIKTQIERRSENREKRGKNPDITPASRGNFPLMIERQYARRLTQAIDEIKALVDSLLIPRIPTMVEEVRSEDTRRDTYVEDFMAIMSGIKVTFGQTVTETIVERTAQESAQGVDDVNSKTFTKQINQVTGVNPLRSEPWIRGVLSNHVQKNVALIKSAHESYFKDIELFVMEGLEKGQSTKEIAKKIAERTGVAKRKAQLIARDQVATLNSNLASRRATDLGLKRFRWSTSHDERVRSSHRALDNNIYTYKEGANVDGVSGVLPGQPINCRCVAVPVISSLDETDSEAKNNTRIKKKK